MEIAIALVVIVVIGFGILLANSKPDTTTPEEIATLSQSLRQAISEAEETVGKFAPHSADCQQLLANARYCLNFSGRNSRLVVSAWMIKQKRIEGIKFANQAAQLALDSRKN